MTDFLLNGEPVTSDGPPDTPLLWVLRDELGLKGTKFGCGIGQCGACTVHLDGETARACVTPVSAAAGREVTTIEGLATPEGEALKAAWIEAQVPQCGYCQSGQLMTAASFLAGNRSPSDAQITTAMTGNLCRCMAYVRIHGAVRAAAAELEGDAS